MPSTSSWSRLNTVAALLLATAPVALSAQDTSPPDITITRLGYRATKASASFATYAVGREIGMSRTMAAVSGATVPVVVSKALYLAQGSPGGPWPDAGFAFRDIVSEIAEGSGPLLMVWARSGGRREWWRWPVATMVYGSAVYATWEWGTP